MPIIPRFSLSQVRIDLAAAGVLLVFLCGWHWRVTGDLTPAAGIALALFLALCVAYGSVFKRLIAPMFNSVGGMPFTFLSGYFVFNSLLFVTALCSPFGMVINLAGLAILACAALLAMRKRTLPASETRSEHLAGVAAILLACIGATIWCGDAQTPPQSLGANTLFQIWPDVYIHAREISVFAQAHGIASIQDIKLAGGTAPIYHFASYLSPAAISALTGVTAMQVYASLQLPLGIMLTGLAAFCLMGKLLGMGPGLAATAAIVLIPDAYQQGFQNRYLSYNFLAQINLGMLYGIACAALAWTFMLDGCRRGKAGPVLLAYGFLVVCLFYKAHLFVANSYLLMIFPFVFFTRVRPSWRVGLGMLATGLFCLIVSLSQSNPRVPVLRLDGSGIGRYIITLIGYYDAGFLKQAFTRFFLQEKHRFPVEAAMAAGMLLISTLGLWLIALALTLVKGWRTMPALYWWFPVLVVGNFLVMTMGLAEDTRGVGSPDELINRPLVWAYFVVAAWSAATGYRLLAGSALPRGKAAAGSAALLAISCAAAVASAPNLETLPHLPGHATYLELGSIPTCLVQSADYLRRHSPQGDVIQDGENDPLFMLTALAERQSYVGDAVFGGKNSAHSARLAAVATVPQLAGQHDVQKFFDAHRVDWYLQHPGAVLAWPTPVASQPAFVCGGYRLFHFVHGTPSATSFTKGS